MSDYVHADVLVDTRWVAEHFSDPHLRLIEADVNASAFDSGHIPGAQFWNVMTAIVLSDFRTNFDISAFESVLSRSGIANDTAVIVYSSIPSLASWTFWFLKLFGHKDVRVLNGGRKKWTAEGRPLVTEVPEITPTRYVAQQPDLRLRATIDEVQNDMGKPNTVILDARTAKEYNGELFLLNPPEGDERAGHIPGAVNVYYETTLNEDGTFKSHEDLAALYAEKGVTLDKSVITYCTFGGRSGYSWFVLKYLLGIENVRNYDAGWMEWGKLPDAPIESSATAFFN